MPELYPYQRDGVEFLSVRKNACLADEQGLGKTAQVIAAASVCRLDAEIPGGWRILICCPSVMLWNWKIEWEHWTVHDDRYQVIEKLDTQLDTNAHVVVCSHRAIIELAIRQQLAARTWNLIVLDECHFFRNPETLRALSFYGQYTDPKFESMVARAHRCWTLSGTPMPNDVRDLWTMCWGLWPHTFTSPVNAKRAMNYDEFLLQYAVVKKGKFSDAVVGVKNVPELRRRLRPHMLRRRIADVMDLPPLRFEQIALHATTGEIYNALDEFIDDKLRGMLAETSSLEEVFSVLRSHSEFATWRKLTAIAKVQPVLELLDLEINHGSLGKILVFAHHTDVLLGLEKGLAELGIGTMRIAGDTSPKKRTQRIARFQVDPACKVGLLNIVAGGTGATLTEATETLMVELSFSPGENGQAIRRFYRIGQDRPCRVRYAVLAGTCDEVVVDILRRKSPMIREVLSGDKNP